MFEKQKTTNWGILKNAILNKQSKSFHPVIESKLLRKSSKLLSPLKNDGGQLRVPDGSKPGSPSSSMQKQRLIRKSNQSLMRMELPNESVAP